MPKTIDISSLISFVSVCGAIIFGYIAMKRNNTRDIEEVVSERATLSATVITKLDAITESLNEIKRDNRDIRAELTNVKERVAILEAESKEK